MTSSRLSCLILTFYENADELVEPVEADSVRATLLLGNDGVHTRPKFRSWSHVMSISGSDVSIQ